jgi:ribose transport system substrate-binding protein
MRPSSVLVGVLAVAASVGVLSACSSSKSSSSAAGSSAGNTSNIRLAAVLANTSDPFFASISCATQDEAQKRGVKLQLFNTTSTDANQIANNFQSATLTNPAGIIVTPFNNNQFVAQYKTLMGKGVPVVTGNGSEPQAEYKYLYSDSNTGQFAEGVLKNVPSGAGSFVYLGGAPGIPPLESRTLPFVDAVAKARPGLTKLPNDYSGFDINKATTTVSSLILAHPDLTLIIAADGPDGQGAAAALKHAGKAGKITLVAFDAVPPEVAALKDGTITYLIAQSPFQIGRAQVDALVDYLKGGHKGAVSPSGKQAIANKLLTKDTIDMPQNADYVYKTSC